MILPFRVWLLHAPASSEAVASRKAPKPDPQRNPDSAGETANGQDLPNRGRGETERLGNEGAALDSYLPRGGVQQTAR